MDKSKYMQRLHDEIAVLMERPVTLGRAEEICVYADTICALGKMQGSDHFRESTKMVDFTEADARRWTEHMENDDGSKGAHWTMEQTKQFSKMDTPDSVWYAAMNMMYSDYCAVARKYGLDRPDFYADMAHAFLFDKDAGGPEGKLSAYYHCIAEHED